MSAGLECRWCGGPVVMHEVTGSKKRVPHHQLANDVERYCADGRHIAELPPAPAAPARFPPRRCAGCLEMVAYELLEAHHGACRAWGKSRRVSSG